MSTDQNTIVVLFNYGGGMRGLIPAYLMSAIEERTGLRMSEMVDIFAGPSTGAILNAALNVPHDDDPTQPKWRARHMVKFYEREGSKIFPADRFRDFRAFVHDFNNRTMKIGQLQNLMRKGHYDPSYLSYCLRGLYGKRKLSETLKSLIIPVYNIDGEQLALVEEAGESANTPVHTKNNFVDGGGHAVWLKHIQQRRNRLKTPDVELHDAILASAAAPTYFPCHHFKATHAMSGKTVEYSGIDGSIFDNPCISYHGAIRQHIEAGTRVIMILLGTGYTHRSFKKEAWNNYGGLGVVDPMNDLPLINILFHAPESALIESFRQELGDDLFVFNKSLVSDIGKPDAVNLAIDDAGSENLKRMSHFSEAILEEQSQEFDRLCHILVRNRDSKPQKRSFWSKVFG